MELARHFQNQPSKKLLGNRQLLCFRGSHRSCIKKGG